MKNKLPIILFLILVFLLSVKPVSATDPHLFFSPASAEKKEAFSVEVKIDTGGKAAGAADIHIEYPKALLRIDKVTKPEDPAFTQIISSPNNDEGKLRINAYFSYAEAGDSFTGSDGTIAKIDFTPLGTGVAAVKFTCNPGSTTESNIADKATLKDVIICPSNGSGSYNLTSSGSEAGPTATPTQGSGGGSTATPKPTAPVSGSTTQTIGLIGLGIISLLTGLALAF